MKNKRKNYWARIFSLCLAAMMFLATPELSYAAEQGETAGEQTPGGEQTPPPTTGSGEEQTPPPTTEGGEQTPPPTTEGGDQTPPPTTEGGEQTPPPTTEGGEQTPPPTTEGGEQTPPPTTEGGEQTPPPTTEGEDEQPPVLGAAPINMMDVKGISGLSVSIDYATTGGFGTSNLNGLVGQKSVFYFMELTWNSGVSVVNSYGNEVKFDDWTLTNFPEGINIHHKEAQYDTANSMVVVFSGMPRTECKVTPSFTIPTGFFKEDSTGNLSDAITVTCPYAWNITQPKATLTPEAGTNLNGTAYIDIGTRPMQIALDNGGVFKLTDMADGTDISTWVKEGLPTGVRLVKDGQDAAEGATTKVKFVGEPTAELKDTPIKLSIPVDKVSYTGYTMGLPTPGICTTQWNVVKPTAALTYINAGDASNTAPHDNNLAGIKTLKFQKHMKVTLQNGVKVVNEIPNTTPSDGIDDAQTAVLTDVDGNGTDEIEITSWLNSGTNPGGMRAFIPANAVVVDATSFNVDFYSPVANTVVEIEKNIKPEITIPAAYLNTSIAIKVDCASVWDIPEPDAALIYRGSTDLNAKVNEATTKSMRLNYDTSRYTINKTTLFGGETYDTAQQSVNIDSWFTGLPTGIHATLLLWYYNPVYDTNTGAFLYNEKRYYDDYEIPHVVQFSGTPTQLGTFDATLKIPETTADGQRILNIKQDITLIHEDQVDNLIWNITQDGTGGGTGGSGNTGSGSGSSGSSNTNNNTNNNANTAKPGMGNNGANWSADWFMNNYLMMSAGNLAGDLAGTDSTDKTMIVKATLDNYLQIIAAEEAYNGLNDAQKAEINARLGGTTYEQLLLDARLIELWVNSGEAEKVISAPEKDSVPKTGDNTPMTALMILTVVSGIGALVTARRKRAVR